MAVYMEDAEFDKLIEDKGLVSIVPKEVSPRVWYKNLHRFNKNMIAGEVAYMDGDTEVCVPSLDVELKKDGEVIQRSRTSTFGEFYFDHIEKHSGEYEVCAEIPGRGSVSTTITMTERDVDTGLLRPGMEPVPSHPSWDPITE